MKVLVTGADGFVGRWLIRRLLDDGREVYGAVRPSEPQREDGLTADERAQVRWLPLEITDNESVRRCLDLPYDAVVHLAAIASGAAALRDPGAAWEVNAAGTARVMNVLAEARRKDRADPVVLHVSTGEVYGRGQSVARKETDTPAPCSPYAASKLGAEEAALEAWRRSGLRVVVARAFAHTGPGQTTDFVIPAFAQRLNYAKQIGAPVVKVGNLEPIRDLLHVQDVADAYVRLLAHGHAGEVYNVASGKGTSLEDVLFRMAELLAVRPIPEADPQLMRPADIPHLVGDSAKLRAVTGWSPRRSFDDTLRDVLDAQKN
ncbi:MAG TPA: GDP-mannose 4,6-dehydratase [Gemmatimonadales bacterium]|nr:GDP-mannose 4,6-dehydratase [Gemmatimonadales bacterium]